MRKTIHILIIVLTVILMQSFSFASSKTHFYVRSGNGFYCNADTLGDDDVTTCEGAFDNMLPLSINTIANSLHINMCTDKNGNLCYNYDSASACLTKTTRINGNKLKHDVTNRFGKKMTYYDEGNLDPEQFKETLKFCD